MSRPCVVVIEHARTDSTRLPSKVLMDFKVRPLLQKQRERLARACRPDATITATTTDPLGLEGVELARAVLETASREATAPADREHNTRFIWRQPGRFRLGSIADNRGHSGLRWTVNTPEDLKLIRRICADVPPSEPLAGHRTSLRYTGSFPNIHALNAHVDQKT